MMNYGLSKSAKIELSMSKIDRIFFQKKNIYIEKYQFRRPFKKKNLTSIFEPLYFLKSCPIFDEPALVVGFF